MNSEFFHPENIECSLVLFFLALIGLGIVYLTSYSKFCVRWGHKFFSLFLQKKSGFIKKCTLFVFIAGVFIYCIGFYNPEVHGGKPVPFGWGDQLLYGFSVILRSFVSSLEMFVSHSDLIEVTPALHHNPIYMATFVVVHSFAIILSVGFILSFISYHLKVNLEMKSWEKSGEQDVYIFWGMNAPSLRLAESLKRKANNQQQIVFVTEDDHSTEKNHRLSFGHLLGTGHAGATYISKVERLGGVVMAYDEDKTYKKLCKLADMGKNLHFIFFSDDETFNLSRASKVMTATEFSDVRKRIFTYCHARRELINMALLDSQFLQEKMTKDDNFNLVDSSIYAVEGLKALPEAQPVNFVDLETEEKEGKVYSTGAVTSAFKTLIIGFSETGQEALSFLYEYGAFVDPEGNRSPFSSLVIDKEMETIEGTYLAKRPALRNNTDIRLEKAEVGTKRYWELITEHLPNLNYVVIALGNDKLNTTVAVELYNYVLQQNSGVVPEKFVIYVRLNKRRLEEIQGIESLYFNKNLEKSVIRFFGAEEDVFNEDLVLNYDDRNLARKFEDVYNKFYKLYKAKEEEKKADQSAEVRDSLSLGRERRRKFLQNLSNARHICTKIFLLTNKLKNPEILKDLSGITRTPSIEEFNGLYSYGESNPYYTKLMMNVAQCEHLRWVASHEMLGYTVNEKLEKCNDRAKQHPCMVSWQQLMEKWAEGGKTTQLEYTCYDYNVVEASICYYMERQDKKLAEVPSKQDPASC